MKCRGRRLKSCCCCVDLRVGCCFLAIFEICTAILGFMVGEEGRLFLIGRTAYLLHFLGSIFLLMSSFLVCDQFFCGHSLIQLHLLQQIEVLVIIYLGTNLFHLIFCTAFLIDFASSCVFCLYESIPSLVTLVFSFYFWMVAFAYLRRLQWEHNLENDD
ncbi:hypothetical protein KR054_007256 [Drosophila jambulina]|nr:hypothetical protein KR054_007256 [Drosophila jambulina]